HHNVFVIASRPGPKLEPVSSRLKQELIHPNRNSWLLYGVRFSPDGKRVIAGAYPGGVVVVWDRATGKQLTMIDTAYQQECFFLTADWQRLFVSRQRSKRQQVEQNGKLLRRWEFNGDVRAWDVATGQLQRTLKHQPPRNILAMQLSPDGRKFVTTEPLSG